MLEHNKTLLGSKQIESYCLSSMYLRLIYQLFETKV